ncbi:hypothetical protein SSX86_028664 [Deinandra increscens subsp. villosa]|uniref:30S ribosomal protein S3, chloroplastic n=1 Tax=Deinandra increscens subsp. villosa TaxID=3103831 RepID=A0AAP0GJV0_9ASTR
MGLHHRRRSSATILSPPPSELTPSLLLPLSQTTTTADCRRATAVNLLFSVPFLDSVSSVFYNLPTNMATQLSKKRKFVADGVFFAELNEVLTRELAEDGYSGVEVRVTPMRTEIIIRATRTQNVLGEKGRRIRELTSLVQKRFKFPENSVELYAERVNNRGLCAIAQAESLRYKLLGGLAVRRACYGVLRFVMENGAKGCEVIVSGKLRAQRAKSMKFKDGYMVSSGQPVKEYIDSAVRHVLLRQGVLGIKVKIMLDWDPTGKLGPKTPLPDNVIIHMPKDDVVALPPKEVEEYRPPLVVGDEPLPMPMPQEIKDSKLMLMMFTHHPKKIGQVEIKEDIAT